MNILERQIIAQQKHIDKLYETIKAWENLANDKDKIINKYQEQVENYENIVHNGQE